MCPDGICSAVMWWISCMYGVNVVCSQGHCSSQSPRQCIRGHFRRLARGRFQHAQKFLLCGVTGCLFTSQRGRPRHRQRGRPRHRQRGLLVRDAAEPLHWGRHLGRNGKRDTVAKAEPTKHIARATAEFPTGEGSCVMSPGGPSSSFFSFGSRHRFLSSSGSVRKVVSGGPEPRASMISAPASKPARLWSARRSLCRKKKLSGFEVPTPNAKTNPEYLHSQGPPRVRQFVFGPV